MKKMMQLNFRKTFVRSLFLFTYALMGTFAWSQNIFSGEPVQVVGQMNSYSTAASSNSTFRRVSTSSGNPTDGRGQWFKTYNVQSSGGDFTTINMAGGGGSGFLFISGPSGNRFANKWAFSGVAQAGLNVVNGFSSFNSGNDMGLNMSTAGRYTFVFNDAGYTLTNSKFYVAYTSAAPVTISRSSQSLNFDRTSFIGITTSATPSSGEAVYVRYTTASDFSSSNSSSVVQATGSGTSWSATIPAQTIGSSVRYYVFTSTASSISSMSEIDKSISTLNYDDNSGANYSYTLTSSFTSTQSGNLSSASTFGVSQIFSGASYTIANGHTVTLSGNTTIGSLTINSGGTFDNGSSTLTVNNGSTLANGGNYTASTGTISFAGTGAITGTWSFNNVILAGGVTFSSGSTVNGNLTINVGGFVNTTAPSYGTSSTLIYSSGTVYGRGTEWSATTGAGYPNNVQINSGTTLNLGSSGTGTARQCAGNLTINSGGTLSMNETGAVMTAALTVRGNFTNNGTITLSGSIGGDLILFGNLDDNGTFTANTRAIFFDGSNTQTINSTTDPLDIDVMRVQKTGGEIVIGTNLLVDETNDPLQVTTATSVINLNGKNLTIGKGGTTSAISMVSGSMIKCNTASSITIAGNGTLGTLRFDPSNNTLKNLTINAGTSRTVTLGNALNIIGGSTPGIVSVGSGSTLNTGGLLTLKSDVNGTASIGNSAGTITGNVIVERYISGSGRRWRYLGAPVTGQTLASWGSQFYITGPGTPGATIGSANSNGYATTRSNLLGFNNTAGTPSSVRIYNRTASGTIENGWANPVSHMATTLTPGVGYRAFVRGPITGTYATDTAVIGYFEPGSAPAQSSFTFTQTGGVTSGVNAGSVSMPINSTGTGTAGAFDAATDGWNLLANPYPCAFDWAAFWASNSNRTNISNAIHVFDATSNSYKSYSALAGSGSLTNGLIPSATGFFVQATGTGAALTFTEAFKTNTNSFVLHKTTANNELHIKYFRDSTESDEYILKMIDGATLNKDDYDITKMKNDNLNLSSYGNDSVNLTLSSIPVVTTETRVSMNVEATQKGTYYFNFTNLESFSPAMRIQLLDKFTQKTIDVRKVSSYTFVMDSLPHQWGKDRFVLILNDTTFASPTSIKDIANEISSSYALYPVPTNDVLNIAYKNNTAKNISVDVFDTKGNLVSGYELNSLGTDGKSSMNVSNLAQGIYFIQLSDENGAAIKTMKFVK